MERRSGATIDHKYRLVRIIGDGGFGEVWLADELGPGRRVAIKFLKVVDEPARRRFAREAQTLQQLEHPHCVEVFDFGVWEQTPYLVTAFVRGETLDRWLQQGPSVDDRLVIAAQVASAVAHAHARQIVHRDIKPANVLVQRDDVRGPHAMLLDFGVAKLTGIEQTDVTKTGEIIGTPGYMSPEQLRAGAVGTPSDVYSLGVMLFEMLSGAPLFRADSQLELAMLHLTSAPPEMRGTGDPETARMISAMLAKDPSKRPPMTAIAAGLRGEPYAQVSTARFDPVSAGDRRPNRHLGVAIVLVSSIAIVAALLAWPHENVEPQSHERRPISIVKGADDHIAPPQDSRVIDTPDLPDDTGPDYRSIARNENAHGTSGCGKEPKVGLIRTHLISGESVSIRVPTSYQPDVAAPVLLLLHDVVQPPEDWLQIDELMRLADRDGLVVVVPDDNDVDSTWLTTTDIDAVIGSIELAGEKLCVDTERVFIIGHGNGGGAAQRVACSIDGVVAMAHTSHRFGGDVGGYCRPRYDVPTMIVSMLDDPTNPIDETRDCLGHQRWTLAEHERVVRKSHGCKGGYDVDGPACQDLDCRTALRLCHPRGGRDWAAMRRRLVTNNPFVCKSPPGAFDFVSEIWSFFVEASENHAD